MREVKTAAVMIAASILVMTLGIRVGDDTAATASAQQQSRSIYESIQTNVEGRFGIQYIDIEEITQAEMSIEASEVTVRTCMGDKAIIEWEVEENFADNGIGVEMLSRDGILQIFTCFPKKYDDRKEEAKLKIQIFLPDQIKEAYLKCDKAAVIFSDETDCDIWAAAGEIFFESRQHRGSLEIEAQSGNVRINSDRLAASKIHLASGNIEIDAFLCTEGEHRYTTDIGNIKLSVRNSNEITPQLLGGIDCEEGIDNIFCGYGGARCLYACTKIGLIAAKGSCPVQ